MQTIEAIIEFEAAAVLGEGPVWDEVLQRLYWIDIKSKKVYRYDPVTKHTESWDVDQMVGCIVPLSDGRILCALQDKLVELNTADGSQVTLAPIEAGSPDIRCNDGKADAAGRLWVGTLHIPGDKHKAALYRVDNRLLPEQQVGNLSISNGLGWSLDNRNMYLVDTPEKHVLKFDFSLVDGTVTNQQVILKLDEEDGSPDGMCVDAEGMIWIAFYGGKKVGRYDPATGKKLAEIKVPAINVTCCTFGGSDLDTLYITTARDGVSEEELKAFPGTGSLFSVKPGVKGLPANAFREKAVTVTDARK
jgi:sugar lactone lactonase YvrE